MGTYIRLVDYGSQQEKENAFLDALNDNNSKIKFMPKSENFSKIPGSPIAYWASNTIFELFKEQPISAKVLFRQGMATSDNNRFLRLWYEVNKENESFESCDLESAKNSGRKWFAYNKGGSFRKWYGNAEYVVNWENDGSEMKAYTATLPQGMNVRLKSREYYFKKCYSWSKISSGEISFRYYPCGFAFDVAGCCVFNCGNHLKYYLGLSNSVITRELAKLLSPTLNYELDHLKKIPTIVNCDEKSKVDSFVESSISLSKDDWDSFETSWDFKKSPLL